MKRKLPPRALPPIQRSPMAAAVASLSIATGMPVAAPNISSSGTRPQPGKFGGEHHGAREAVDRPGRGHAGAEQPGRVDAGLDHEPLDGAGDPLDHVGRVAGRGEPHPAADQHLAGQVDHHDHGGVRVEVHADRVRPVGALATAGCGACRRWRGRSRIRRPVRRPAAGVRRWRPSGWSGRSGGPARPGSRAAGADGVEHDRLVVAAHPGRFVPPCVTSRLLHAPGHGPVHLELAAKVYMRGALTYSIHWI